MANQDEFNRGIILPTIIKQLKSILQQYPDDGQILKELIQNGEDAGARKLIFLLDTTSYPARQDKLHHPDLASYQGPALYVYNDAVFTADDWKGIRMLNDSVKEKDPMKVGRFGLGFKSVFHMTDLPSIFSGNGIGFLDTHEQYFQVEENRRRYPTSSYLWDLKKSREEIQRLEDQFQPFHQELFGLTSQTFSHGYFNGTVFRFPMRMEGMHSDLCDTKYDASKVRELFQSLETDAHIMLMFLKSLECIEVYEKSSQTASPTKITSINIARNLIEGVKAKRLQLINQIEAHRNGNMKDPVSIIYPLNVEFQKHLNNSSTETSNWIISQYYAGKSELESAKDISETLGLLPWVAVALPIQENSETPSYLTKPKGHIFCFLPLPLEETSPTGLRVHVHGYFAVDSNRRHLKWPTADQNMNQLTDKSLIWNEFLVNKLLVKAIVKLALHVANPENRLRHDLIFDIIPDQLTPQWKYLAEEFYKQLPSLNIFYSPVSGGQWMNSKNGVFDNIEDNTELQALIRRILLENRIGLVSAPMFLKKHFVNQITPTLVCQSLKNIQNVLSLQENDKFILLKYFLDNFPHGTELISTRLLPLADGTWTDFKQFKHAEKIYVESTDHPRTLLPSLERMFLRPDVSMFQQLKNLASRNVTQLVHLQPQYFSNLLPSVLPSNWQNCSEVNINTAPLLTVNWLHELWTYLTRYFPNNLNVFENLHILPVGNGQLLKLSRGSSLLLASHSGFELPADVKIILRKLGIRVIDDLHASVGSHPQLIGSYVLAPDATNVVTAMSRLFQRGMMSVSSLNHTEKKTFQAFLSSGLAGKRAVVSANKTMLCSLSIFQTLDGSGFKCSEFVSLSSLNRAAQTDVNIPVDLPEAFIDLRENLVRDLAFNLGAVQFIAVQILENYIFPAVNSGMYDAKKVIILMSFVCDNFSRFQKSSSSFTSSLSNVRFVQKSDGQVVTPRDVFDNSDQTLQSLFVGEEVFAVSEFGNSKYCHILRQLGMKGQNSVTASDLLRVAEKLNSSINPDLNSAQTLLVFLENHTSFLDVNIQQFWIWGTLSTALQGLKWVKPDLCRPTNYPRSVKFIGESYSTKLVLPTEVCSTQFGSVVGSVKPTVNSRNITKVAKYFGWTNLPNIELIARHLLTVVSRYTPHEKSEFQFTVKIIYKYLNYMIYNSMWGEIIEQLRNANWVWYGEGFATPCKVVKTKPFMDLQPHVYLLPSDLREFTHLWNFFGVSEKCCLVKVLKDIDFLHRNTVCDKNQVKRDLQIAVDVLNEIASMPNKLEILDQLLVPINTNDDKLQMKEINDVTYCDKEWFQKGLDVSDLVDDDIFLVHPLLPLTTAEALKIHGLINRVLDAEELGFGFESYGQSEPLTRRLNSILKDYTDGLAVLKELVQNADDSEATEVKFLYDERRNEDAKTLLLDKGMTDLQGPALWAYNNAAFTPQDFQNLVKLSGATKEESKDKIGRFGLGFNAVYNLTDVPSLVSQNHVVFLDPHTKYLGRAIRDKSKPGLKLDIKNNRKQLKPLIDQFKPYNGIFDCDFSTDSVMTSYPGTLFRFPLRTPQQANSSEICKKCYSHQEMMLLLELLSKSSHHLLLFTQHVRKITVFHLPDNSKPTENMLEWFTIEKSLEQVVRSIGVNDVKQLERQCSFLKVVNQVLKETTDHASGCNIPKVESSLVIKVSCTHSKKTPMTLKSNPESSVSHWLVASCLGRGTSLEMAKLNKDLTPVGGIAAKLTKTDEGFNPISLVSSGKEVQEDEHGLLFCFLPLPIRSCFPVHINGSFALTSSRMHIFENTVKDKKDERALWNKVLVKDAITEAYLILMEDLLKVCTQCDPYVLWPVHKSSKEAGFLFLLTETIYNRIFDESGPRVIREGGQRFSMTECRYLEEQFRQEPIGSTALKIFKEMKSLGFKVTDIPLDVYATIKLTSASANLEERVVTKAAFFEQFFLPRVETANAEGRDALVLYALFDQTLLGMLKNVSCIPTKPKRSLKTCSELINPLTFFAVLFLVEEEVFPDLEATFDRTLEDTYRKLVELGMKEVSLSWKEISERCSFVTKSPKLVSKRLHAVVQLMSSKSKLIDQCDREYVEQIKRIRFLPTVKKPHGFPLKWKGEEHNFVSCEEGYLSNLKHLICCLHPVIDDLEAFRSENDPMHPVKSTLGLAGKTVREQDLITQLEMVLGLTDSFGSVSKVPVDDVHHLRKICNDLYKHLNSLAGKGELSAHTIDTLLSLRCIFIESASTFMSPGSCALETPVKSENLMPYLCQIPRTMMAFTNLLPVLKVRKHFQPEDYVMVLRNLNAAFPGVSLTNSYLQVALCIVNWCLTHEIIKNRVDAALNIDPKQLFIPDEKGILFPADSLCYNNCPWLIDNDSHFCHGNIAYQAATTIGVKTVREDVIDRCSVGIEFGQKEKLVNRLKRILTGYPFDKEVLKEMLQNADDARATEIHFINDTRHLPTERIFEDKWKPLQEPALCIFNNKPFTQSDIRGIQNLGEGSKSEDPTKTGQYGVGFNCVYHLTDAPTFLTQVADEERVLCAFDPTLRFVPGAKETSPGRMMKDVNKLKERFPDVFEGYFEELYGSCGGTVFRLPLRNAEIAQKSTISKNVVTSDDVTTLFKTFKTDMYESLLFLNSVEEIQLKEVDQSGKMLTVYKVHVELTQVAKQKRQQFDEEVKKLSRALRNKKISLKNVGVSEVSYELITKDTDGKIDKWQIIQRFGFEASSSVSEKLNTAYSDGDIGLLPRCGIAYLTDSTRRSTMKHKSRLFCFLPLPVSIDFPAHVNGHFALDHETRRNLWSDEHGGYKTEWNKCIMGHILAPAYCTLIQERRDLLCYGAALSLSSYNFLFPNANQGDGPYLPFLCKAVYEQIGKKNLAVLPILRTTRNEAIKYFWIGPNGMDGVSWKMWTDMGWNGPCGMKGISAYFDDLTNQIKEPESAKQGYGWSFQVLPNQIKPRQQKKRSAVVRDVLVDCGFLLIDCPISVSMNFKNAGVRVETVSPDAVLSFFATYNQPNTLCRLGGLPKALKKTLFCNLETLKQLLKYCTGCDGYKMRLIGMPFLLTADNYLRCFDCNSVKYEPFFNEIVPHIQDQFLNYDVFETLLLSTDKDEDLCEPFTVQQFADALPGVLPLSFKQDDRPVKIEEMKSVLNDGYLKWLSSVWKYLHSSFTRGQESPKTTKSMRKGSTNSYNRLQATDGIVSLMDWCLLPVKFNGQEYLYPIKKSRCVINFAGENYLPTLAKALQKIGVPQQLLTYFYSSLDSLPAYGEMYLQMLGTLDNAASVVMALEEVVNCAEIKASLSRSESTELLRYLSNSFETWKNIPSSIKTCKKLPIFTTVYNRQVALAESCVYVIPSKIPVKDMESWTSTRGIIFLKNDDEFEKLFHILGCAVLSETEVYCSYIFQHFQLLSYAGQLVHLTYVRDKLLINLTSQPRNETSENRMKREEERDALLESLHDLGFIPTDQGTYECASQFYDNQNDVFLAMHELSEFPPGPYDSPEWNDFLKQCGMISCVTKTMFLQYAREIEQKALVSIGKTLREKSKVLVNHLFTRDDISDSDFSQKVKTIRFVPPHTIGTDKENLHACYGSKNLNNQQMMIPFKNSITAEHTDIVWTAQHVLPDWAYPRQSTDRQFILTQLEIQEKAKPEIVAEHTKRLCTKWAPVAHEFKPNVEILAEVLKRIYAFLKSNTAAVSKVIGVTLKAAPCVLDIDRCLLVRPDQVVLHMHPKNEITPYLIRLPFQYGEFAGVFEALGSTSDATIDQYAMVLEMVHDQAKDEVLDPNEKEAVCKATEGFIALLGEEKEQIELDRELYLPGTDDRVHISSELLLDNSTAFRERLKQAINFSQPLLIDLKKECNVSISEHELERLIRKLPANRQPRFLTSVVVEMMEDDFVEVDSAFVRKITGMLHSDELKNGIVRLALHGIADENGKESENEIEKAIEGLQNIRLVGVNEIRSYLVYRGQRIEKTERNLSFYIREEIVNKTKISNIYICGRKEVEDLSPRWLDSFYTMMTRIVQRVTQNVVCDKSALLLSSILKCGESFICNVLDEFNIKRALRSAPSGTKFRPRPGQFVPIDLHHLLKQDILLLRKGDFVALETNDPVDEVDGMTEHESHRDPTYIMVKILKVLDEDGLTVSVNYLVDDGHSERTVNAALLYAFHRTVTDASDLSAKLQVEDATETVQLTLNDAKRDIKQTLLDARELPEATRKKYIKRLLLRWHPDKNPDQQQLATEATQYLFEALDKLEKGLPLDGEKKFNAATCSNVSSHNSYCGAYYIYISKRANQHRKHQEQYRQNYQQNAQNVEERRERDFIRSFIIDRNPQPGEGRRWLRQAQWDLKAAVNDESGGNCPCGEWACFKYYQAALKALKGAQYARDANNINRDFREISTKLENPDIRGWSSELQRIVWNPNYMQYPTDHQLHTIPHDVFTDDKVQRARELSQKIVEWCKNYIG